MKRFIRGMMAITILVIGVLLIPLINLSAASLDQIWQSFDYPPVDEYLKIDLIGPTLISTEAATEYVLNIENINGEGHSATGVQAILIADPGVHWQTNESCQGIPVAQTTLDKLNTAEAHSDVLGIVWEILSQDDSLTSNGLGTVLICDVGTMADGGAKSMIFNVTPYKEGLLRLAAAATCNEVDQVQDNNSEVMDITVYSGYRIYVPFVLR